jgi:hypothetical protein
MKVVIEISYEPCEKETHISTCDETKTWRIYTLQSKIVNKLKKIGIEPTKVTPDGEYFFEGIPFNQISFRATSTRTMSDENKAKAADRLRKARETKSK